MYVSIYTVTKKDEQDKLITELTKLRRVRNMKPMKVNFYAEENWKFEGPLIQTERGPFRAYMERGPERVIRDVKIK